MTTLFPGNRPHPADSKPLFSTDDSRLELAVCTVDPRIHFALVCGAKVIFIKCLCVISVVKLDVS